MSADGKPARGRTRILTDSAKKRNRKKVLANYNKTRVNIDHKHDHWMELKEALRHKCKHQCHCACRSEMVTCIINDAGRQVASFQKTAKLTGTIPLNFVDVLVACFYLIDVDCSLIT
jgi:hypothetical protein